MGTKLGIRSLRMGTSDSPARELGSRARARESLSACQARSRIPWTKDRCAPRYPEPYTRIWDSHAIEPIGIR